MSWSALSCLRCFLIVASGMGARSKPSMGMGSGSRTEGGGLGAQLLEGALGVGADVVGCVEVLGGGEAVEVDLGLFFDEGHHGVFEAVPVVAKQREDGFNRALTEGLDGGEQRARERDVGGGQRRRQHGDRALG